MLAEVKHAICSIGQSAMQGKKINEQVPHPSMPTSIMPWRRGRPAPTAERLESKHWEVLQKGVETFRRSQNANCSRTCTHSAHSARAARDQCWIGDQNTKPHNHRNFPAITNFQATNRHLLGRVNASIQKKNTRAESAAWHRRGTACPVLSWPNSTAKGCWEYPQSGVFKPTKGLRQQCRHRKRRIRKK